jgi:hypothetical protein
MIKWLKSILGYGSVPAVIEEVMAEPTPAPKAKKKTSTKASTKKTSTKKATTKKASSKGCDFDKLNKTQLLKEAKQRGVKANASLSKSEILSRLKSA